MTLQTNSTAPDASAFDRAIRTHRLYYLQVAQRHLGADDAEDAVQEALLRAWKMRHQFQGHAKLSTWIATIVRMECLSRLRTAKSHGPRLALDDCPPVGRREDPTLPIYHQQQRAVVLRLLPRLPTVSRRLVCRILCGESVEDMTTSAYKAARHRAVVGLRSVIAARRTHSHN